MADDAYPLPGVTSMTTISQWENFFHQLGSGVLADTGSQLAPSLDASGRNIVIASGAAILRGFYKPVSASTSTAIPAASSQNRIDRLVLRLNRSSSTSAGFVVPTVITGTPAASPQVPAITRTTSGLWDLPIAHWTSASNGSLTSLVDERPVLGAPLTVLPSAGGTPVLERAGLLLQPDTNSLLASMSPGGTWRTVWQYDTWHSGGGGGGGWNVNSNPDTYFYYTSPSPGIVQVTMRANISGPNDGASVLANPLPAAYRPPQTKDLVAYSDLEKVSTSQGNNVQPIISVHPDGSVTCRGFAFGATVATCNGSYPVSSPF